MLHNRFNDYRHIKNLQKMFPKFGHAVAVAGLPSRFEWIQGGRYELKAVWNFRRSRTARGYWLMEDRYNDRWRGKIQRTYARGGSTDDYQSFPMWLGLLRTDTEFKPAPSLGIHQILDALPDIVFPR